MIMLTNDDTDREHIAIVLYGTTMIKAMKLMTHINPLILDY
jgi:hypothetical protein